MGTTPTRSVLNRIQRALGRHGLYTGPLTGTFDAPLIKAIQKSVKNSGYTGLVSGTVNSDTAKYARTLAKNKGKYDGAVTAPIDEAGWEAYAKAIEDSPRGTLTPAS